MKYYQATIKGKKIYYRFGVNPETQQTEFYDSKDHVHWRKHAIVIEELTNLRCNYKIPEENSDDTVRLSHVYQPEELILTYTKNFFGQKKLSLILNPIKVAQLPKALSKSNDFVKSKTPRALYQETPPSSIYMSLQLIGLFSAVLGACAVALAFTVLSGGALGVVCLLGSAFTLAGIGLFAYGRYKSNELDDLNAVLAV